jgi:hypothetical protein
MFKFSNVFDRLSGPKLRSGMLSAYGVKPYVHFYFDTGSTHPGVKQEWELPVANRREEPTFGQSWRSKNFALADRGCA